MIVALWGVMMSAHAGPGFSGVGGGDRVPGLGVPDRGPEVTEGQIARVLERETELLAMVERYDPSMHRQLLGLRDTDRRAYVAAMIRVARNVERSRNDPQVLQRMIAIRAKSREINGLVQGFSERSASDQRKTRAEIVRLASELMDLKQQDRRSHMKAMQARLDALRTEIEERDRDRARIVDQFVDQLLREPAEL